MNKDRKNKYIRVVNLFNLFITIVSLFAFCIYFVANSFSENYDSGVDTQKTRTGPIIIINIDGTINPAVDDYVKTSYEIANSLHSRLLIMKLNTPGGLLSSMESISRLMLDARIPTVVFVGPSGSRAISAGMFITIAANIAVMSPGTTIGAAHPVTSGGDNMQGDVRDKLENYASSFAKSIAEQRGRNIEWVEKAVRDSVALTDREAVEKGFINFIASDIEGLISELEGRSVNIKGQTVTLQHLSDASRVILDMSLRQKIINVLADPNVAVLLGLAAVVGIMMELYHPGTGVPGIIGIICLVLSLAASQIIPLNHGGVALLLLGVAFIIAELFVPSFGIWGGSGTICFILGAIYAVDTSYVWSSDGYGVSRVFLAFIGFLVGFLCICMAWVVKKLRESGQHVGSEALLGVSGYVMQWSFDEIQKSWVGKVKIKGEIWNAKLDLRGENLEQQMDAQKYKIEVGTKVTVTKISKGMVLEIVANKEKRSMII